MGICFRMMNWFFMLLHQFWYSLNFTLLYFFLLAWWQFHSTVTRNWFPSCKHVRALYLPASLLCSFSFLNVYSCLETILFEGNTEECQMKNPKESPVYSSIPFSLMYFSVSLPWYVPVTLIFMHSVISLLNLVSCAHHKLLYWPSQFNGSVLQSITIFCNIFLT